MLYCKINKVAKQLIDSVKKDGKVNCYGEPYSRYFPIIEHECKTAFVNITEEQNGIDNTKRYSLHCINQIGGNCFIVHTDGTTKTELMETIKDVMAQVLCTMSKKKPEQVTA